METTLKVKFVAFAEATPDLYAKAESKLRSQCTSLLFENSDKQADIIYFISGGSELEAVNTLDKSLSTILLAGAANNAWAAATEVKAFANQNGIDTQLVSADNVNLEEQLIQHFKINSAFENLKSQRLGLIGSVSDWLVSSDVSAETLKKIFGIELIRLPYEELEDYLNYPEDPQLKALFPNLQQQQSQLGSVSSFLKDVVTQNKLDAITIQCFRMVKEKGVTACLPVALINYNGIPAGCEGDLVSISSIMFVKALTGIIPWMANMVAIESSHILLTHCTIPLQHAKKFVIDTHYETDLSASIRAELEMEDVTIFRMNNLFDAAFIAEGKVIGRPNYPDACRTQLEVAIKTEDLDKLITNPLGNHHLVISGKYSKLISEALRIKNIRIV